MTKQQAEAKFVNEYMYMTFGDSFYWTRVHLGALPLKDLARMYQVKQHWADAVAIRDGTVFIIEAKLANESAGIGQLDLYEMLFRQTPRFKDAWNYKVVKRLLVVRMIPELKELAKAHNIEYVVYAPDWVVKEVIKRKGG